MTTEAELAERVGALENRVELWDLVTRYGMAVDDDDYEALGHMFVEDAEFHSIDGGGGVGSTAIVDYIRHRAETKHAQRVHTPTSQNLIELTSDTATGVVSSFAALFPGDGSHEFFAFRYLDRYRKVRGQWRFAHRRVHSVQHIHRP